ncbi:hypothetical protein WMY93_031570, partial [Mugilogobius chulae]
MLTVSNQPISGRPRHVFPCHPTVLPPSAWSSSLSLTQTDSSAVEIVFVLQKQKFPWWSHSPDGPELSHMSKRERKREERGRRGRGEREREERERREREERGRREREREREGEKRRERKERERREREGERREKEGGREEIKREGGREEREKKRREERERERRERRETGSKTLAVPLDVYNELKSLPLDKAIDKLRALTSAQTKPQPVSDPGLTPDPRASRKPERSKSTCEETSRIIK